MHLRVRGEVDIVGIASSREKTCTAAGGGDVSQYLAAIKIGPKPDIYDARQVFYERLRTPSHRRHVLRRSSKFNIHADRDAKRLLLLDQVLPSNGQGEVGVLLSLRCINLVQILPRHAKVSMTAKVLPSQIAESTRSSTFGAQLASK